MQIGTPMPSTQISSLIFLIAVFSVSHASAQYPEEYPQQQAQPQQQQPSEVPVVSMIDQPAAAPVADSPAVARAGGFRLNIQGYLGFGGAGAVFLDGRDFGSFDLTPTFGIQAQGLFTIGDYVLVGPALSFRSVGFDDGDDERVSLIGVDAAFGGHYAIALGQSLAIDPYLLFTLGLAVATASDISADDVEVGFGFGVRAGATLWFASALGVSLGLGYQSAHFYPDNGGFGESAHYRFHELAMEIGLSLRFGE